MSSSGERSDAPSAGDRFATLVQEPEPSLGEGCLLIAEHSGHEVTTEAGLSSLAALADDVAASLHGDPSVDAIGRHLFLARGFRGAQDNYYDPRNSLLGDVLRRRIGIPITLAILIIEVSDRLGGSAQGVGMPGHFLVGDAADTTRWMDPFDGGSWLDAEGARQRFQAIHGPGASFDLSFLRPTPRPQILGRVLANLAGVHRETGDPTALLRVLELRASIPGVGTVPRSQVELAEAYVTCGRVDEAITVLEGVRERIDPRRRAAIADRIKLLAASRN